MARLSDQDARTRLAALTGWEIDGDRLRKRYAFDSFRVGGGLREPVAGLAEAADHHPDILVEYRHVTLTLTTHDSGGLTARDFSLAARIDA